VKYRHLFIVILITLSLSLVSVLPCWGQQYREYYIYGKIVDENQQPIAKVFITLRDVETSRGYNTKTNKKGEFKLAGLPHGIYSVTMEKEGYRTRTDEWRFETPQNRMQKVDLKTIVMASESKIQQMELNKELGDHLQGATTKIREKDFDGAIKILEKMLDKKPDDANALYLLGICYLNEKMLTQAIESFTEVTRLNPSFAGGHYQLGISYQQSDEKEKALASYQKALELEPDNLVSLYNSGLILYGMNRAPEAVTYFEKALKIKPGSPEILEMAGLCYIQKENYAKALEYLEKAKAASTDPEKIKSLEELVKELNQQVKQ
jgi:tetratricopeptide (TPR) repeat protein